MSKIRFSRADLSRLPAAVRDTFSALSPVEQEIVRGTLDGVAVHRIAAAIGWPEHRVRKWRTDRGVSCDLSVGDQTRQAMQASGRSGGRPISAPTKEALDALYGSARYRDVTREDVERVRLDRLAAARR